MLCITSITSGLGVVLRISFWILYISPKKSLGILPCPKSLLQAPPAPPASPAPKGEAQAYIVTFIQDNGWEAESICLFRTFLSFTVQQNIVPLAEFCSLCPASRYLQSSLREAFKKKKFKM